MKYSLQLLLTNFDQLLSSLLGVAADGEVDEATLAQAVGRLPQSALGVAGDFDENTGKGMGILIQALKKPKISKSELNMKNFYLTIVIIKD